MKHIIFLFIILINFSSFARPLTENEKLGELTWQVLNLGDMMQTIEIAEHPDKWYETNPTLGRNPSKGEVISYFALRGILHYEITKRMDHFRWAWLGATIVPVINILHNNYEIGIRLSF